MKLFSGNAGVVTARWNLTQTPPTGPQATATLKFTYDPTQVPPGVIGGEGTMTDKGNPQTTDTFTWVFQSNVLTWQLTNQKTATNTTFMGLFDGNNTVNGNYCNYQIGFVLGAFSAVYQGS